MQDLPLDLVAAALRSATAAFKIAAPAVGPTVFRMQKAHAMRQRIWSVLAAGTCILAATVASAQQGPEDATLAYPNVSLSFTPAYLADDLGLFAKHGLRLKALSITGP